MKSVLIDIPRTYLKKTNFTSFYCGSLLDDYKIITHLNHKRLKNEKTSQIYFFSISEKI